MNRVDWHPNREKLRQFGWISLGGFSLIGLVVAWRTGTFGETGTWSLPLALWGLALVTWLTGLLAPPLLKPLYVLLTAIALPVGLIVSNVALALIFTIFIVPLALWFRLTGRDELQRAWDTPDQSFWLKADPPRESASYYRPF